MSKERTSITVDPEVAEYLSRESVNASGLVNKLVKQYMNGGGEEDALREFRMQQVKSEYEDHAQQARRRLEEYNRLREEARRKEEQTPDVPENEAKRVRMVPREADHPVVENIADELGMSEQELLTEVYDE